ncbi:MAG TPA: TlpA disulfide reductase family protein [Candidatus Dormibacteraeota bacterium]|nr:TlpA disulfide reductase family protein [Candidatus Dormibacteraeota bacterium]
MRAAARAAAAAALLACAVTGCGLEQDIASNAGAGPGAGAQAPEIRAALAGGGTFDLAGHRGHAVVIDFYASWCAPCQAQQAELDAAATRYAGRVTFVGVDMREGEAEAVSYIAAHGVPYGSVVDADGSIAGDYDVPAPPTTVVVDPGGRVLQSFLGGITAARLAAVLDPVLATTAVTTTHG